MDEFSIVTVTSAAASQNLVTLDEARAELDEPPVASNTRILRYIASASSAIATYCGRTFMRETVTESFRPVGLAMRSSVRADPDLPLARYPIGTVSSVVEDDVTLTVDVDYEVDPDRGIIRRLCTGVPVCWSFLSLVVTYSGGYAASAIPDDLKDAALRLVAARWSARGRDPYLRSYSVPGVVEASFWVGTLGDGGALPPEVAALCDPFRELRV